MAWRSHASPKPLLIEGVEEFTELLLEARASLLTDLGHLELTGNPILLFARVDDSVKDASRDTMIVLPCESSPLDAFHCPEPSLSCLTLPLFLLFTLWFLLRGHRHIWCPLHTRRHHDASA